MHVIINRLIWVYIFCNCSPEEFCTTRCIVSLSSFLVFILC